MDNINKKIYYLYDENGNLCGRRMFKINKLNGEGKIYDEDWMLHEKGIFKDGKLNGRGEVYYKSGKLFEEGMFRNDELNGEGKVYNEDGNIFQEGIFRDGELSGKGKRYIELQLCTNYVIVEEGNFLNGQLNGYGKTSVNGKIFLEEGIFKNGKIVKTINSTESNDIPLGKGIFYDVDLDNIPLKFRDNKESINIYLSCNINKYDVKYSGKWDKEKFNGYGEYYNKDDIFIYRGLFKNGYIDYELELDNWIADNEKEFGKLRYIGYMNESQPCGFGEVYFENNVIKYRGYFKNGKLNGYGKIYYNGNLRYEGFFYKDELIMIIKQYDNYENLKSMAIESSYNNVDNFIFSGELYYPNGALKYAGGIEFIPNDDTFIFQGIGEYYYDNGQLCCAGKFINGQLVGKNKIFNSSGNLKVEGIFVFNSGQLAHELIYDDKNEYLATLNGYGILYHSNGKIWEKGNFKNNMLYGKSEIYYNNGNLKYKGNLKIKSDDNNINYGIYFTDENIFASRYSLFSDYGELYHENGQVKYRGNFEDGKYEGSGKEYYPNGILKYEGQFKKGLKEGAGKLYNTAGVLIKKGKFDEYTEKSIEKHAYPDYSEGIYWNEGYETEDEFWEHE